MKKRYSLIILTTLLILTGCGSKSSVLVKFDDISLNIYDNKKNYVQYTGTLPSLGLDILVQMKESVAEDDTGFVNSLLVAQTPSISGIDLSSLVDANTKQLQLKFLGYVQDEYAAKHIDCKSQEYSWYITTFSYQLGEEILYQWQYYIHAQENIFVVTLSSDEEDDISRFVKSFKNIRCK